MNKNVSVVIRKVGNGYLAYPLKDDEVLIKETVVFQEKGGAFSKTENPTEKTLFGFLDAHFQDDDGK